MRGSMLPWARAARPIPDPPAPPSGDLVGTYGLTAGRATFGVVAPEGLVPAGSSVALDGLTTQADVLNTWPSDGSARHLLVSASVGSPGDYDLRVSAPAGGSHTPTWPTCTVAFVIGGTTWTATLGSFDGTNTTLNGAVCRRAWVLKTPKDGSNNDHPLLQVIFEVTSYAAGGHHVCVTWQNVRNAAGNAVVAYDLTVTLNGSGVYTLSGHEIWTGQRFHAHLTGVEYPGFWTAGGTYSEAAHDFGSWVDANVIPPFVAADAKTYTFATNNYRPGGGDIDGFGYYAGEADGNQGNSENDGRQEINPWTDWEARYVLDSTNRNAYEAITRNADLAGMWSWAVDKDGGGQDILRIDQDDNHLTVATGAAPLTGLGWDDQTALFQYSNIAGGTVVVRLDREHFPELSFVAYLLTGHKFYLDSLRFQASWAVFLSYSGSLATDPGWPGYEPRIDPDNPGANPVDARVAGYLCDSEWGRGYGRPLKMVARAAWAMPAALGSPYDADYAYFHKVADNNLSCCAYYAGYLDARYADNWDNSGGWVPWIGFHLTTTHPWARIRDGTVTSTTGASPTVLTVLADATGPAGTDDHGMEDGDYATLAGYSGGASGLNGPHPITRISPTQFSVPVDTTGSATSGVGTWSRITCHKVPVWRVSVTAREVYWMGFTGLWTMDAGRWALPDRITQIEMGMQDNPDYDTAPGPSHNFYVHPGERRGQTGFDMYGSWAEYEAANSPDSATAVLFSDEQLYIDNGITSHRGDYEYNPAAPDTYYTPYAHVMLTYGVRRGLAGASAARTRLRAAAHVGAELTRRPGFNQGVP